MGDSQVGDSQTPAAIVVLTESARFVDIPRGQHAYRSVRVYNPGSVNLVVSQAEVSGSAGRVSVSPAPRLDGFVVSVPPSGEFAFTLEYVGTDGVAFDGALELSTNVPLHEHVAVPIHVQYTGSPQLYVTLSADGQASEQLNGPLDVGAIPDGIGRNVILYVKNLGQGGSFAIVEPPQVLADALRVEVAPAADADGLWRLGHFGGFCTAASDCAVPLGASCQEGVCADAAGVFDVLTLTVHVSAAIGEAVQAEVVLPYVSPQGGSRKQARFVVKGFGSASDLIFEPAQVSFGDVSVGFPESRLVRLINASASTLTLDAAQAWGAGAEGVAPTVFLTPLGSALPVALAPFDEYWLRLDFVASLDHLGAQAAQVQASIAERPGSSYTLSVSGRSRIGPILSSQPLFLLDLGAVHVGTRGTGNVVLFNTAEPAADPLTIFASEIVGTVGPGSFELVPGGGIPPIAPGASAPLQVSCRPTAPGVVQATLQLVTDAPDNPVRHLALLCTGKDPDIAVRYGSRDGALVADVGADENHPCRTDPLAFPSPCMDLGALYLDGASTLPLVVTNTGEGSLTVSSVSLSPTGGSFALDGAPAVPLSLSPGESYNVQVSYVGSSTPASEQAVLHIEHDDADSGPVDILLVASAASCVPGLRDCSATVACKEAQTQDSCCKDPSDASACGPSCAPCPELPNTIASCFADSCAYGCADGWVDLDGNGDGTGGAVANGCEYACTASGSGEVCDGIDNDCDGLRDEDLPLADAGGEAPAICTPGDAAGFLGWFEEDDLAAMMPGDSLPEATLVDYSGRVYVAEGDPVGDVDWLRLIFAEVDACWAVGFRFDVELVPPAGTRLELCGRAVPPEGPAYDSPCLDGSSGPVFDTCAVANDAPADVRFEWPETCGLADDRVVDLRVRADPTAAVGEAASCEPYQLVVRGAALQ